MRYLLVTSLAICVALAAYVLSGETSSTVELNKDLADIADQIQQANDDAELYNGGLIEKLVLTRVQVLRVTQSMLEQKRSSLLRRINLRYSANGKELVPATKQQLNRILSDIEIAEADLAEANAKASGYSGGLIQGLSLVTAATHELRISQLKLAYYTSKYGLSVPIASISAGSASPPQQPGKIVEDKDAL